MKIDVVAVHMKSVRMVRRRGNVVPVFRAWVYLRVIPDGPLEALAINENAWNALRAAQVPIEPRSIHELRREERKSHAG